VVLQQLVKFALLVRLGRFGTAEIVFEGADLAVYPIEFASQFVPAALAFGDLIEIDARKLIRDFTEFGFDGADLLPRFGEPLVRGIQPPRRFLPFALKLLQGAA